MRQTRQQVPKGLPRDQLAPEDSDPDSEAAR
jgi:hypothetical protein